MVFKLAPRYIKRTSSKVLMSFYNIHLSLSVSAGWAKNVLTQLQYLGIERPKRQENGPFILIVTVLGDGCCSQLIYTHHNMLLRIFLVFAIALFDGPTSSGEFKKTETKYDLSIE